MAWAPRPDPWRPPAPGWTSGGRPRRTFGPSTRARDESYLKNHIRPAFGALPLSKIHHTLIQAWVADLAARKAPATVHKAHQILSKSLQGAVDAGLLANNPCSATKLPRIEPSEVRVLTPDEVTILAEAMDERYRALALLGPYGGLRAGEMLGLRRGRVDLLRRRVDVAETLVEVKGQLIFNSPKTRAGRRSVPIPAFVASAINDHLVGSGSTGPDDLVFTAPEGGPVRLSLWRRRYWEPSLKVAGIDHLRVHDLRHTAVAFWIAAGASPKEIAVRAGHTSVVTVLDRYGHLLPSTEDHVTDALDEMAVGAAQRHAERGA